MTKRIWTATCSAIVGIATAAVTAQTPAPPPQSGSASADRSIVLTGCLRPAPSSPTDTTAAVGTAGTTGTAGATGTTGAAGTTATAGTTGVAPASDATFVLANATSAPADATDATGTTGATSTTANASAATQTYRLIANSAALAPLVGKKLELTGTLDQDTASPAATGPSGAPALRVKSGKIVAASCSE
jgi:pilus assembly protein FimV